MGRLVPTRVGPRENKTLEAYKDHFNAHRYSTDLIISNFLREIHKDHYVMPVSASDCDALAYANAAHAKAELEVGTEGYQAQRQFISANRRSDASEDRLSDRVAFRKYYYTWNVKAFLVYVAE